MRLRRFGAGALVVLALGSFVVACGDDDDDDTAATGDDTEQAADDAQGDDEPITVTATDDLTAKKFTFDIPSTLPGGAVDVQLANDGKELHDLQFVKASEGHTVDELIATVNSEEPIPTWIREGGGVGVTPPGATGRATLELDPGTYWYFCTESSGGEEEGSEAISHAANGMAGEVAVEGDTGEELPDTDATLTAADYRFDTAGLKAGENTFTFSNDGKQLHHAIAFPIAEGKTFADAQAAFTSEEEPTGPPPVDFERGVATAVIGPGQSQVVSWNLDAGNYVLVCFMGDYEIPGPPHVAKGMIAELKVE